MKRIFSFLIAAAFMASAMTMVSCEKEKDTTTDVVEGNNTHNNNNNNDPEESPFPEGTGIERSLLGYWMQGDEAGDLKFLFFRDNGNGANITHTLENGMTLKQYTWAATATQLYMMIDDVMQTATYSINDSVLTVRIANNEAESYHQISATKFTQMVSRTYLPPDATLVDALKGIWMDSVTTTTKNFLWFKNNGSCIIVQVANERANVITGSWVATSNKIYVTLSSTTIVIDYAISDGKLIVTSSNLNIDHDEFEPCSESRIAPYLNQ